MTDDRKDSRAVVVMASSPSSLDGIIVTDDDDDGDDDDDDDDDGGGVNNDNDDDCDEAATTRSPKVTLPMNVVSEEEALRLLWVLIERGHFREDGVNGDGTVQGDDDDGYKEDKDDGGDDDVDAKSTSVAIGASATEDEHDDDDDDDEHDDDNVDDSSEAWKRWKFYRSEKEAAAERASAASHSHLSASSEGDDPPSSVLASSSSSSSSSLSWSSLLPLSFSSSCDVILTKARDPGTERAVCTRSGLAEALGSALRSSFGTCGGGRAALSDLAEAIGVDERSAEVAAEVLTRRPASLFYSAKGGGGGVERFGTELITSEYLDALAEGVNTLLDESSGGSVGTGGGRIAVATLASEHFRLPLDATVRILSDRMGIGGSGSGSGSGSAKNGRRVVVRDDVGMYVGSASGSRYVATRSYEDQILTLVSDALREADGPRMISDVAQEFDADARSVLTGVARLCEDGSLDGELRGGGGEGGGGGSGSGVELDLVAAAPTSVAVYVPRAHEEAKRKAVEDFFSANGYVTREKCESLGVSAGRMQDLVRAAFPDAVLLADAMINCNVVLGPLETLIQDAIAQRTFVDLKMHIPEDLVANKENMHMILSKVLSRIEDALDAPNRETIYGGVDVLMDGEALYFSPGMVKDIQVTILPPIIEAYGKEHAEEMDKNSRASKRISSSASVFGGGEIMSTGVTKKGGKLGAKKGSKYQQSSADDAACKVGSSSHVGKKTSAKDKSKAKKAKAVAMTTKVNGSARSVSAEIVPLCTVAKGVAESYPDLADVQECYGPLAEADDDDAPRWRNDKDDDDGTYGSSAGAASCRGSGSDTGGGPLYEFCRRALDTPDLRAACVQAIRAESDRIASSCQGGASIASGRKESAARRRAIEAAFEDGPCFPTACRLVRMLARLPEDVGSGAMGKVDAELAGRLERDFLSGCGADFARRVTEYCLFRHGVDGGIFSFDPPGEGDPSEEVGGAGADLPSFCRPVDIAVRSFRCTYLSCVPSDDGKDREPLPALRELLPGNVGVDLARMWVFCGGDCYQGGKKVLENGEENVRPGNFRNFLAHAEESCLSMCGIPFKVMDKKAEKQAIFSRRQQLTTFLKDAEKGLDVLEYCVMLLFQQTKGIAVAGNELSHSVLDLLDKEKKIPDSVRGRIKELSVIVSSSESICPAELVEAVRTYGMCKDISVFGSK